MIDPGRRDDGKSFLRAMVRVPSGRLIDFDELLRDVDGSALPEELWAEEATVASMAAKVRASRDAWVLTKRPTRRPIGPVMRSAVAVATVVITAGSSLALTGDLPATAREFASRALAVFVPSRERTTASSVPMAPTTDQPLDPPNGDSFAAGSRTGDEGHPIGHALVGDGDVMEHGGGTEGSGVHDGTGDGHRGESDPGNGGEIRDTGGSGTGSGDEGSGGNGGGSGNGGGGQGNGGGNGGNGNGNNGGGNGNGNGGGGGNGGNNGGGNNGGGNGGGGNGDDDDEGDDDQGGGDESDGDQGGGDEGDGDQGGGDEGDPGDGEEGDGDQGDGDQGDGGEGEGDQGDGDGDQGGSDDDQGDGGEGGNP
jgi:hypothetical protein